MPPIRLYAMKQISVDRPSGRPGRGSTIVVTGGRIIGFGFRQFAHYRTRVLLYCGAPNWELLATLTPR